MDKFINVKLLANPLNWLVVWMMVILSAVLGHFILTGAGVEHTPTKTETR
jgi:uncharacterized membrane protein